MNGSAQAIRVAVARADLAVCALIRAAPWFAGIALAAAVTCLIIHRMLKH